jgi:ABC-type cobalamin transport system permease subunit
LEQHVLSVLRNISIVVIVIIMCQNYFMGLMIGEYANDVLVIALKYVRNVIVSRGGIAGQLMLPASIASPV